MAGWIFGAAAVAFVTSLVLLGRRNAVGLTRRTWTAQSRPVTTFRGDMRSRQAGGTRGGWARLDLFDDGIRLRGTGPLGPLMPTWQIRYDELAEAQLVASKYTSGIRLCAPVLPDPVTFKTSQSEAIAGLIEQRGVTVSRVAGHLGWLPGD